jgi:acetoin utilization deacetylase AcuC-like enzyme
MSKGWPLDGAPYIEGKLNPSFIPSDIDIPIDTGEEDLYVLKLEEGLNKMEAFGKPQIAVVVLGVDPYEKDELASTRGMNLTLEQMNNRDLLIYNFLNKLNIPQAHLMAGGYGVNSWKVYSKFLEHVLLKKIQSSNI